MLCGHPPSHIRLIVSNMRHERGGASRNELGRSGYGIGTGVHHLAFRNERCANSRNAGRWLPKLGHPGLGLAAGG